MDLAVEMEFVTKRGSFYSYGDLRMGQGRENAKNYLTENPDLADEIDTSVRQQTMNDEILDDGGDDIIESDD